MGSLSLFPAMLFSLLLLLSSSTGTGAFAFQVSRKSTGATSTGTFARSTKLFSLLDVSAQAERSNDGLFDWATQYGTSQENFQISGNTNNWGAVASHPAAAGSRVLYVPGMLCLSSQTVRQQEFAHLEQSVSQYFDAVVSSSSNIKLSSHFYLFLKVLQEYDLGDQSPYYSWMNATPRKYFTGVTFDDFELQCLPPFVSFLAQTDRNNFELFLQVLQQSNTPTISDATKNNRIVTQWAFNVVFTRAREVYGEAQIIPVSDMINHDSNPNVDVQFDEEGNVSVVLMKDVQAGEALFKCYGEPTNPSRFLATYGFFDTSSPATYCKLLSGQPITQELANLGFSNERMVFFVESGGIAQEVWDVMLYTLLENIDPAVQRQFYDAHMTGDSQTKQQLHQFYMATTCNGLLEHVNEMLNIVAVCEAQMDEVEGQVHKNVPMIRRHNNLVRETFMKVRDSLLQMQASA